MNNGDGKNTNNDSDNSAPQGIFSTPELTVDTKKITPAQNSTNSKARVASFFANTDTSKQAEQVQNAMTTPANYATEDLVINNGGKKKRSFLPIVIAVVAILAVVGGVTAYFLVSNNTSQNSTGTTSRLSLKDAYNSYLNFLLFEKESINDIEFNEEMILQLSSGAIANRIIETTNKELYLKQLADKYTALENKYEEETSQVIDESLYDYFCLYTSLPMLGENRVVSLYASQGKDYVSQIISEYYNPEQYNGFIKTYIEAQKIIAESNLEIAEKAASFGCINNNELQADCIQLHNEQIYNNDLSMKLASAYGSSDQAVAELGVDATQEIISLYTVIYGKEPIDSDTSTGGSA